MPHLDAAHVLLATLGGQPQVVTFTLDLLLQRNIPIREVIVIHPAAHPRLQQSIARLNAEFIGDRYTFEGQTRVIHFRQRVLRYYEQPIDDIVDERTANGALDTIGELIQDLKQRQYTVHFSITGGRRLMTFLSFSAALLHFTPSDQLLHLYTPDEVQERARRGDMMHATAEDGIHLIEVPFARAAQPILSHMLNSSTSAIIDNQNTQRKAEERKRCKQVFDKATPRQREVLQAYASGQDPQQVAEKLSVTLDTINSHNNALLSYCREVWPDEKVPSYHFIQRKFAEYFTDEGSIP